MSFANRVEDVVASVAGSGLGAVTLAGTPPALRRPLSALGGVGVTFDYVLEQGSAWEHGTGTITGTNMFSRVASDSSAGGAAVAFSAGARFFHDVSASTLAKMLTDDDGTTLDAYLAAPENAGGTPSDTALLPVVQGPAVKAVDLASLAAFLLAKYPTGRTATVDITSTVPFPLDFTSHNRRRLFCTAAATINGPSNFGSVGNDFECKVTNNSGAEVTFGGGIVCLPAGTKLKSGATAEIFSSGGILYAQLPPAGAAVVSPGQVTGLAAGTPTHNTVPLTWSVPATGTAPFSYTVQRSPAGAGTWTTVASGVADLFYTAAGLTATTAYDFRVAATNDGGTGTYSATASATTGAAPAVPVPGQVTGLTAGTPTSVAVPLSWTAPADGGAPTGYDVEYRVQGTTPWTLFSDNQAATNTTVSGLASATVHEFRVSAQNASGNGTPSAIVTVTTAAAPSNAVITPSVRSGFPVDTKTFYNNGYGWTDMSITGGPTITSAEWAFTDSASSDPAVAWPSGTPSGSTTPKGRKGTFSRNSGTNLTGVYVVPSDFSLQYAITTSIPYYFWLRVVDSTGTAHYFRRAEAVNFLDNRATLTTSSAASVMTKVG